MNSNYMYINIVTVFIITLLSITLTLTLTEGFTSTSANRKFKSIRSSIQNFSFNEKEIGKHIVPEIKWTYRYLSKNYVKLIHEWLMELENIYFGKTTKEIPQTVLTIFETKKNQILSSTAPSSVNKIIDYIKMRLNTPNIINPIVYRKSPYINGFLYAIPLRRSKQYNSHRFYSSINNDSLFNPILLIMTDKKHNLKQLGIAGLPKKYHYDGLLEKHSTQDTAFRNTVIHKSTDGNVVNELYNDRLDYIHSRCFGLDELHIGDRQTCVIEGGIWDKPCKNDSDCPYKNHNYPNNFGKCNLNTGYCQMPKGVKNISYRYGIGKPTCYNCKHSPTGHCCLEQKTPDYMFLNDQPTRYNHKDVLQQKNLNWHRF